VDGPSTIWIIAGSGHNIITARTCSIDAGAAVSAHLLLTSFQQPPPNCYSPHSGVCAAGVPELWKICLHDLQDWTYPQLLEMVRKVFGMVDGGKVEVVL
jgi:hypothetical protein